MAYRLKSVRYKDSPCRILVQNENGPCPLIAAANALLLKKAIELPTNCVGAGVITIDELINVLAEKVLVNTTQQNGSTANQFAVDETMQLLPSLQYGMDVNPKFTKGPSGAEYTKHLNAFDLLHVELVHGWLVDPNDPEEYALIGDQTYNQLVNQVIKGNEAKTELDNIQRSVQSQYGTPAADVVGSPAYRERRTREEELSNLATRGSLIHHFLERSANQLTQYGLQVLHERVKEGEMYVFFRNNHFNTLTKHQGQLYLLVTDLGFATMPDVVWEKLDVIDGDTEYVTSTFEPPALHQNMVVSQAATGEQLVANDKQSQADFQLALQLSRETSAPAPAPAPAAPTVAKIPETASAQTKPPPHSSLSTTTTTVAEAPVPSQPPSVDSPTDAERQASSDYQLALQLSREANISAPDQSQQQQQQQSDADYQLALQLSREGNQRTRTKPKPKPQPTGGSWLSNILFGSNNKNSKS